jgi:hypothetical protein
MRMNLSKVLSTSKNVVTANSPVLLVGTAVTGIVATGVLAAKGGYKARGIIEDERAKRLSESDDVAAKIVTEYNVAMSAQPDLEVVDHAKLTWLCYAAPAVTGAGAIAACIGAHAIHTKRNAALAALYAVTTDKLDDYREKAEELLGPKKTQDLNDRVAQASHDRHPENYEVVIEAGNDGNELMYDEWSGRTFRGSIPIVEKAVAEINTQLVENGDASLNDYYDHVGLPPIPMGLQFGWSGTKLSPRFGTCTTSDGRVARSVWFHQEPKNNMGI